MEMSITSITNRLDFIDVVCDYIATVDGSLTGRAAGVAVAPPEHRDETQDGTDGRNGSSERPPSVFLSTP